MFQGIAPPNVDTTKSTTTTAPGFYTDYLTGVAGAGQQALNRSPAELVAGFSPLQQQAFGNVQNAATSYQPQLQAAQDTASQGAQGITQQNIQNYLNPYAQNVVGEMGRLNQQNLTQNLLPNLKAGFVGTGAGGSQRNAGALAQFLAQNQANLTGQQAGELSKGFTTALGAADFTAQSVSIVAAKSNSYNSTIIKTIYPAKFTTSDTANRSTYLTANFTTIIHTDFSARHKSVLATTWESAFRAILSSILSTLATTPFTAI
jgi:hypothetical protein